MPEQAVEILPGTGSPEMGSKMKPDSDESAKIWFSRNGKAGSFLIEVGTSREGIGGHPQLYSGILGWQDGPGWVITDGAERLSGLPALLDQPAFAHGVAQLYGEIVARQAIGIPAGATIAAVRPYLSKRFAEQRPPFWPVLKNMLMSIPECSRAFLVVR